MTLCPAASPATRARPAHRPAVHLARQVGRYSIVGLACTAAYALLYLALRAPLGATGANTVAMLLTAVANTAANRGLTFGVRGSTGRTRAQLQGLVIFAATWVISTTTLWALAAIDPTAGHATEITVLTLANLAGTALRFLALRSWVFRAPTTPSTPSTPAAG